MRIAFLILLYFELLIQNFYLFELLKEKLSKMKNIMYSTRVSPLVYYTSRLLGDVLTTTLLYLFIYAVLYIGASNLIQKYDQGGHYNTLWLLLFVWKLRYIMMSYILSHLITGCVDTIMKFYMYIHLLVNGPFVIVQLKYPALPFGYFFDSMALIPYSFQSDFTGYFRQELVGLLLNFVVAVCVSTLIDNWKLSRNFGGGTKRTTSGVKKRSEGNGVTSPLISTENTPKTGNNLEISNLNKSYGFFKKINVIQNVSFDLDEQTAFGLVGPNGAGKSTIFNIITSEVPQSKGCISLKDYLHKSLLSVRNSLYWRQNVGVCFQEDSFYEELTVEQNIDFYSRLNGLEYRNTKEYYKQSRSGGDDQTRVLMESENELDVEEIPSDLEMPGSHNPFISSLELGFDILRFRSTRAKNLSSGNKRKLSILLSLLKNMDLMVWDEATCGLDVLARHSVRKLLFSLKSENKIKLLITTHFLNDIDLYCDTIGLLKDGLFKFRDSTQKLKELFGGYKVVFSSTEDCHVIPELRSLFRVKSLKKKVISKERDALRVNILY